MKLSKWVNPKTGQARVYLNGFSGVKIHAEENDNGSYTVKGWTDHSSMIPHQYRGSGNCWALNIFMDQLDAMNAPAETVSSFEALVEFAVA